MNVYAFVFQNTPYSQFLLSDYRRTHNFINWLQSAQRRRYPVLMNSNNVFCFCGLINSGEFLYERFINYWSSHVDSFHKKYEPLQQIVICHMRTTKAQISLHIYSLMSTFVVRIIHIIQGAWSLSERSHWSFWLDNLHGRGQIWNEPISKTCSKS